jgi:hypothetical protein
LKTQSAHPDMTTRKNVVCGHTQHEKFPSGTHRRCKT